MTDQLSEVDQLPESLRDPIKVRDRGERILAVMDEINSSFVIKIATKVVDLQDRVAELERALNLVNIVNQGCPVIFEKGQLGSCYACGKTFECGARVPSTTPDGWDANGSPAK